MYHSIDDVIAELFEIYKNGQCSFCTNQHPDYRSEEYKIKAQQILYYRNTGAISTRLYTQDKHFIYS